MKPPVVVVVPAYQEEASVGSVVAALRALSLDRPLEVVVVDDGSTDRTAERARDAGAIVLRPAFNLGIGGAVQLGLRYAARRGAAAAVQVDGDGQHPADALPDLLRPILAGAADVTIGSRFLTRDGDLSSGARRAGIAWLSALVRLRCGRRFTDPTSGLRAFGPRALTWLAESYPEDYPEPQVLAPLVRKGLVVAELPVAMRARQGGASSIQGWKPLLYMAKVSVAILLGSME